jgi:hypothetical protein
LEICRTNKQKEHLRFMSNEVDILENEIRNKYPEVLEILLRDHTTQKNIFWATDNYREFGSGYEHDSPILPELITGECGRIIMPRYHFSILPCESIQAEIGYYSIFIDIVSCFSPAIRFHL